MPSDLIGQVLNKQFRVDAFIDAGGMGSVFRVWDLQRNVPLAMKALHAEFSDDPAMFKRFQREARALKKLAHPHIVPFYGLYQSDDFSFLLERFVDGPTLKDVLKKREGRPLEIDDALTFMKAIGSALGYAHSNGVVHCDVKSGNVMIDQGGNIYLADFGIARHADSTTTTMAGAGTPAYMAPEQITSKKVGAATDIYALGILLYELLAGQKPFSGNERSTEHAGATANERVRYAHLNLPVPDPRSINPGITPAMAEVLFTALEKDPARRYQSCSDFISAACRAAEINFSQVPDRIDLAALGWIFNGGDIIPKPPKPPIPPIGPSFPAWLYFVIAAIALGLLGIIFIPDHPPIPGEGLNTATTPVEPPSGIITTTPTKVQPTKSSTTSPKPSKTPMSRPSYTWNAYTIDSSRKVGVFASLSIIKDVPYVVYLDDQNDNLKLLVQVNNDWLPQTLAETNRVGWFPSIAVDSKGAMYIAFATAQKQSATAETTSNINLIKKTGGGWNTLPMVNRVAPTNISLAMDSDDHPLIAFLDKNDRRVKLARLVDNTWEMEVLGSAFSQGQSIPEYGMFVSMKVDANGVIHVVYNTFNQGLQYVRVNGQNVKVEEVDTSSKYTLFASLGLNTNGVLAVSYYDSNTGSLKVAFRESNGWKVRKVDEGGDVGQYSSIAVDSLGNAHISYYDATKDALKYSWVSSNGLTNEIIDSSGVGTWTSIALDSKDMPLIAYYDFTRRQLKYAGAN